MAAPKGRAYTSSRSRSPSWTAPMLRPPSAIAVAEEVLRGGEHTLAPVVTLQAADEGRADGRAEVRVLAVALLDATPPCVAGEVEVRGAGLVDAEGAHLPADDVVHRLDRLRVPRRREAERSGEVGTGLVHETGQRLVVDDRGDAEPRALHEEPLELVEEGHEEDGIGSEQRAGRDLTEPVGEVLVELLLVEAGRTEQVEREDPRELRDLLVERHAGQQVVDPLGHRSRRVPVGGSTSRRTRPVRSSGRSRRCA